MDSENLLHVTPLVPHTRRYYVGHLTGPGVQRRTEPRSFAHIIRRTCSTPVFVCVLPLGHWTCVLQGRGPSYSSSHLSTHDRCWFSVDMYCIKEDRNETCGFRFLQNMQRGSKENMDLWFILSLQSDAAWGNICTTCYHVDQNNKITGPVVLRTDDVIVKEDREKAELLGCHSSFIAN